MTMENNTGKNIIDATQNAVIEAAENVSNIIAHSTETTGHGHEVFYLSAEFWVAMAFVLTILLLAKPIYKAVNGMITKRIEYISRRLANAAEIKDDAEKLLASYERKFRNIDKEVEAIIKKSQNEIDYIRKASLSKLEQDMAQKEKDVSEKLQGAKDKASQEIANIASGLSIRAVRQIIQNKLQPKDISKLIDISIKKLEKI